MFRKIRQPKQSGAMIMDNLVAVGFVSMLGMLLVASIPAITYRLSLLQLQYDIEEIRDASVRWKQNRFSGSGLRFDTLCNESYLSKRLCSNGYSARDLRKSNPFGGDYKLVPAHDSFELTVDVDNSIAANGKVNDIIDTLAPLTIERCQSGLSCSSIGKQMVSDRVHIKMRL
ncbi:hypothetical protein [Vibrio campbellii]|uniref:hypothetical protein n=2 Tax=Vibrio TaxID=662 RepID=UPI0014833574|nr:hypothetical protein [Vibrio campbellii]